MNLTDRPADVSFEDLTCKALADEEIIPAYHLREVVDAIDMAAKDKKLKGIFLTGGFVPSGYGCKYETILNLKELWKILSKAERKLSVTA